MKKVNFFKVMSACMAFAAVTFTSCTEEEMTLNSPEVNLPESPVIAASASVAISVYDVETNFMWDVIVEDATASIGSTYQVNCPAIDGYIVAPSVEINIPALNEGQNVVIPVTFYVASEGSAAADIMDQFYSQTPVVIEKDIVLAESEETIENDGSHHDLIQTIESKEYKVLSGYEYIGETEAPASKGLVAGTGTGYEFVAEVLKKIAFKELTFESPVTWINPYHFTTVTWEQTGNVVALKFDFNGGVYYAKFKATNDAWWTMAKHQVIPEYAHDWAHTHAHGTLGHDYTTHGYDGSLNAGGGITDAE